MANLTQKEQCRQKCTRWGAAVGLAAGLLLWLVFGWGFIVSLILAIILGALSIFALLRQVCDKSSVAATSHDATDPLGSRDAATGEPVDQASPIGGHAARVGSGNPIATSEPIAMSASSENTDALAAAPSQVSDDPAADEPTLDDAIVPASTDTGTATAPVGGAAREATAGTSEAAKSEKPVFSGIKPTATLKGQQELASRKGSYRYAAPKPEVAEPDDASVIADITKTVSQEIETSNESEAKPVTLDGPRAGGADDFKLISGVGPKMEQTLNKLGIYHFDQIAQWGPQEVAWVDARLRFKGRIKRDNWIGQAAALAAGGAVDPSKRRQ